MTMMTVEDKDGQKINPAIKENQIPPQGSSGDGTIALVSADTWYAVPDSAPTEDYTIVVSLENADGTIRWSFDGGGAPSVTNGNLAPNHLAINMGANKTLYFGSSTAGDDVNYSYIKQV